MTIVYQAHNHGLGDHIATLGCLRFVGELQGFRQYLSTQVNGMNFDERFRELESLLDPEFAPILIRQKATTLIDGWYVWNTPGAKAAPAYRWSPQAAKLLYKPVVCYQFDGQSSAKSTNPSPELEAGMLGWLQEQGVKTYRLGKDISLTEAAGVLSRSMLFVGADSGFSHLAHAVGVPVFIYNYKLHVPTCHKFKQFELFSSLAEFKRDTGYYLDLYLSPDKMNKR